MKRKFSRAISILIAAVMMLALPLAGCSSKDVEAAKQIESYMQQQEKQAKEFIHLDIDKLDAPNAVNIIKELTSPKYKGRKTGTKENEMAVQYVANYFKSIGLKNPEGLENYLQPYYQSVTLLTAAPKMELLDQSGASVKSFDYPKHFVYKILSDSTENINMQSPMKIMNSAAELRNGDLTNNALLFSLKSQGRNTTLQLMRQAYAAKASVVILEMDTTSENRKFSDLVITPLYKMNWGEQYMPVIGVDSETYTELAAAAQENKKLKLECSYKFQDHYKAANVIGYIPGSDDKLKNEYVIIGGHMDHVGDNMNGTYNPGALDNASGTAAMMEIARMLSNSSVKPKKTIVFIAFNGEEWWLNGSDYYSQNPVFDLNNSVMINLDMVGSSAKLPLSIANGDAFAADLKFEFLELAKILGIEAVSSTVTASDHTNFADKGVPAVMLAHSDELGGYHSPNDTMEDINEDRLKEVLKLVLYYLDRKAY